MFYTRVLLACPRRHAAGASPGHCGRVLALPPLPLPLPTSGWVCSNRLQIRHVISLTAGHLRTVNFRPPCIRPNPSYYISTKFMIYIYVELICQRMYFYSAKAQGEDHESTSFSPPIHKYFPVPLSPVPLPPNPLWLFQESCAFKAIRQCREGKK